MPSLSLSSSWWCSLFIVSDSPSAPIARMWSLWFMSVPDREADGGRLVWSVVWIEVFNGPIMIAAAELLLHD